MSKAEYSLDISPEVCRLTTLKAKVFKDNTARWLHVKSAGELTGNPTANPAPPLHPALGPRPAGLITARA